MINENITKIVEEIRNVLSGIREEEILVLVDEILRARRVVTIGAGRVGLSCRAFSMRLAHLGLEAYNIGDSVVPATRKGDLIFVCSGSGETQTIVDLVGAGKSSGARIALITGNPDSRMGRMADVIVELRAPSKTRQIMGFESTQPMTSLNEQCLFVLCDAIVLVLMEKLGETHETMWKRHSVLE